MSGTDGGFKVSKPALETFAQTSQQRAVAFGRCLAEARQLNLSPDAFGRLPVVSSRCYTAYERYVSGCEKGIGQAATAMSQIKGGINTTIADYQLADSAAEDNAAAIEWEAIQSGQITSPGTPAS
jgi:hypothetical protein